MRRRAERSWRWPDVVITAIVFVSIMESNASPQALTSPVAPQVITWLYTSNLATAEDFLKESCHFTKVFDGGATKWSDCGVWQAPGGGHVFSLGLCANGRDPPTSLDEAAVTVTLVETTRASVDAWHSLLSSSSRANVTDPEYSKAFNVYAFNFYDTNREGLANYRFEVQTFADPEWPPPNGATNDPPPFTPQQVTWMYTADLVSANAFVTGILGFEFVLKQITCNIYAPNVSRGVAAGFLGVCNSRPAPQGSAFAPVIYSLVASSKAAVDEWHTFLTHRTGEVIASVPAEVPKYNVYGFDFNDAKSGRLSGYRFNVQVFNDRSWPAANPPLGVCGQSCSTNADCDPNQPCKHCENLILGQCVTGV